jgi:multimeric flavodoxin WrbA
MTGTANFAGTAAVFACSPRGGGNTDRAAALLAEGVVQAGGAARVLAVRDYRVFPCTGCQGCAKTADSRCVLMAARPPHPPHGGDQAEELLSPLLTASVVFFASPIFFYHLPAQLKGLIDRSQRYYAMRDKGDPRVATLPRRPAYAVLAAGRPTGDKLFEGSLLTLKYFLFSFNIHLAGTLLFRGKDQPGDLGADPAACDELRALGERGWLERGETAG